MTKKLYWLAPVAVLLGMLLPAQSQAQWPTFDAANFATAGKIWKEDISTNQKLIQEIAWATKQYAMAVQIYGVASREASYIRNKQIFLAAGFLAQHAILPGHPDWDKAMTSVSGIAKAGAAWQQMTAPGGLNSFSALNNRIQMATSFGTEMLNAIGSCNASMANNDNALAALEGMGVSLNGPANTRATQANIGNMASTQNLRVQQCQQAMAAQQLKIQALQMAHQQTADQVQLQHSTDQIATANGLTVGNTASLYSYVDR